MKKWSTKMIVEAGIMIGLAIILSRIKIYESPQGGSVTAGSMLPIILFSFRWGVGKGIIAGLIFGTLKLLLGGYVIHPIQGVLEYVVAFGGIGLAGIFHSRFYSEKIQYFRILLGTFVAIGIRFICHLLAGVIFFSEYAGLQNPWIYSIIYNLSYLIPEFFITFVLLSLIWKPISKIES